MMFHRVLVSAMCLAGFVITVVNGGSVNRGLIEKRSKTELTSKAVTGLLAWRKLLWNSKPAKLYRHGRLETQNYHKQGDFVKALRDFLSVVPVDKNFKQQKDKFRARNYEGIVGDRKVVLREKGAYSDNRPTIEISNEKTKDKIVYIDSL